VQTASGEQSIQLSNGTRVGSSADHHLYQFRCLEPPPVADDAPVTIWIGQQSEEGSVVSIQGTVITISVKTDFGVGISNCRLQVDMSYLVETLLRRFDAIGHRMGGAPPPSTPADRGRRAQIRSPQTRVSGGKPAGVDPMAAIAAWNSGLPDLLLGRGTQRPDVERLPWTAPASLRPKQAAAVAAGLAHPITLIWGPPGTGKSHTVAELLLALLERQTRILVVSNTNRAVDELLTKCAGNLAQRATVDLLVHGGIVRHGTLSDVAAHVRLPGLTGTLADYVSLEYIVARLSHDLATRKSTLLENMARIEQSAATATAIRQAYLDHDRVAEALAQVSSARTAAERRLPEAQADATSLPGQLVTSQRVLADYLQKGVIGKFFSGDSATTLQDQIAACDLRLNDARRDASELPDRISSLGSRERELVERSSTLQRSTAGTQRASIDQQCAQLEASLAGPRAELQDVNAKLAAVQDEVLKRCRCLFATATQVYLKPKQFTPAFDVVIIEEATMLLLPAAIYAAGLATHQVVITGDYQQLPAIVTATDPASQRWLARDLFTLTGNGAITSGSPRAPKISLDTQSRMAEPICDLINPIFYDGGLRTVTARDTTIYPDPVGNVLTVLDTSAEMPFVRLKPKTFSRYSILHAHAIRNLCVQLLRGGMLGADIAVMSPYKAQVQVLAKLLEPLGADIQVGTVHRFQGAERRIVIFDICDSFGLPYLSRMVSPTEITETGAKLLNVAISRAIGRLVVVANLGYLNDKLPGDAILRDILHPMTIRGAVVPCDAVFSARDLPTPFTTGFTPESRSVYNERDFEEAFMADLARATRYVVIQSAFLTPQRLAGWEQAFRALIAKHVRVRIVTRPPATQGSIPPEQVAEAIALAQEIGLIVDLRYMIHQKSAIVDGTVVWHGSLNILSFTTRSEESMYRIISPPLAEIEAQFNTFVRAKTRAGTHNDLADRENPPCPSCAELTVLHPTSRCGAYLQCMDPNCGWKCSVDRLASPASGPPPKLANAVACTACARPMVVRSGRTGYFLGCAGYPACRSTQSMPGDEVERQVRTRSPRR